MKTITRIAQRFAARIANNQNAIVTEDTAMNTRINNSINNDANNNTNNVRCNTVGRIVRRAASLLAFAGLLALTHAAKADAVVDRFEGPQNVYNSADTYLAPGTTAMQLKVHNTSNYTVSGVPVTANIYFPGDIHNGYRLRAAPSTTVSLAPNQVKWINLIIPDTSLQGQNLHGQYLYAQAVVSNHTYWLNNFLDAAYNIQAQESSRVTNADGSVTFAVTFTNICHIASPQMPVTVNYAPYGEGDVTPKMPLSSSLPVLQPGQWVTRTFTTRSLSNYAYSNIDMEIVMGTD